MWILLYWINDFMLANKKLTDNTNLFSPYDFNKNDQLSHEEFVMTFICYTFMRKTGMKR